MLRRCLLSSLPLALGFWTLFALHFYAQQEWASGVSILISQPAYLLEEVINRFVSGGNVALLTQISLGLAFLVWSAFLTLPYWSFPAIPSRHRKDYVILCCLASASILISALLYTAYGMIFHMH